MHNDTTGERIMERGLFGIIYPLELVRESGLPTWARVCLLPLTLAACFVGMLICFPVIVVGLFVFLAENT